MPSTLIKNMIEQYNYPVLNTENVEEFIQSQQECVLFFTSNPIRYPESDDVAMILPELVKQYGGRFTAAVVDQSIELDLKIRFGFRKWPALVFLREGKYLGAICKVQDWVEYIEKINEIMASEPRNIPDIIIPVKQ